MNKEDSDNGGVNFGHVVDKLKMVKMAVIAMMILVLVVMVIMFVVIFC